MKRERREAIAKLLFLAGMAVVSVVAVVAFVLLLVAVRVGAG